ncbi:MAG TPA: CapA family protein, partial [Micromonosporaceae bacterium]
MKGSWDLAVAGEAMVSRPFSMHDEPEFLGLAELLRSADFTYTHLEMNFGSFGGGAWPARGGSTGSFMLADPAAANDLRWLGVDAMSLAHNHSLDFGATGIRSTIAACLAAGIACAGTGNDLEEARGPAYVETRRGRVALISMASGNTPDEWAGLAKGTMPGRPGVNPLRVNTTYTVPADAFRQLTEIGEGLGILRRGP